MSIFSWISSLPNTGFAREMSATGLKQAGRFLDHGVFSLGAFAGTLIGSAVGLPVVGAIGMGLGTRHLLNLRRGISTTRSLGRKLAITGTTAAGIAAGSLVFAGLGPLGLAAGAALGGSVSRAMFDHPLNLTPLFDPLGINHASLNRFTIATSYLPSIFNLDPLGSAINLALRVGLIALGLLIVLSIPLLFVFFSILLTPTQSDSTITNTINAPPFCQPSPVTGRTYCFPIGTPDIVTWTCDHHTYAAVDIFPHYPQDPNESDINLPLYAFVDGTVIWTDNNNVKGGISFIMSGDDGVYYYYSHNQKNYVSLNQRVTAGDLVGTSNSSGNTRGLEMLHFGAADWAMFRTDPPFLEITKPHLQYPQYYFETHLGLPRNKYGRGNPNCLQATY